MIRTYLVDLSNDQVHLLPLGLSRLGREPGVEVEVDCHKISRNHCAFVAEGTGRVLLNAMGSANGTYVDGVRIERTVEVFMGQVLSVGLKTFRVGRVDVGPSHHARSMPVSVSRALVREQRRGA